MWKTGLQRLDYWIFGYSSGVKVFLHGPVRAKLCVQEYESGCNAQYPECLVV